MWLNNYFTGSALKVESRAAADVSATSESTATAVESVATTSVEAFPPHATNVVAIAKIANTFFIFLVLVINKYYST
jgi:hypothetical protein